jgi:DNA repair exonuclease SbcCD ATPase subunit
VQRHSFQASRETTPTKSAVVRSSILDEVEGTLSATITELQELQGVWHTNVPAVSPEFIVPQDGSLPVTSNGSTAAAFPSRTSSRKYRPVPDSSFPPMPQSAREPNQGQHSYDAPGVVSQSLPPFSVEHYPVDPPPQSVQKAHEEQRQQIHILSAEKEHVQRQLAFFRSKLNEFDSEKAASLRATKETEENLQITLNRLREAKVAETAAQNEFQSARNEISILLARCEEGKSKVAALNVDLDEERVKSGGLQAKLGEVNSQKVDLLERELELRMEVVVSKKKLKKLVNELRDVKKNQAKVDASKNETEKELEEVQNRNRTMEELLKQLSPQSDLPSVVADMAFRLEDLQRQMKEKDEELERTKTQNKEANLSIENMRTQLGESNQSISSLKLEKENFSSKVQSLQLAKARESPSQAAEMASLQSKLDKLQSNLTAARAEREQFSDLLHAEVRRTAVEVHERDHPALPLLKKKLDLDEAVEIVRKRAKAWLHDSTSSKGTDVDEQHDTPVDGGGSMARGALGHADEKQRIEALEKEIEYYLNDIVLYKLDVKGYKKDLRKARERIRELADADEVAGKGSVTSGSSSGARTDAHGGGVAGAGGADDGRSESTGGSPSNMI